MIQKHPIMILTRLFTSLIMIALLYSSRAIALEPLDSIAVVVNDDVITSNELENKVKYYENQLRLTNNTVSDRQSLRKQDASSYFKFITTRNPTTSIRLPGPDL